MFNRDRRRRMVIQRGSRGLHDGVMVPEDWERWVSKEEAEELDAMEVKSHLLQPGRALRVLAHAVRIRRTLYEKYGSPAPLDVVPEVES